MNEPILLTTNNNALFHLYNAVTPPIISIAGNTKPKHIVKAAKHKTQLFHQINVSPEG